MTLSCNIGRRPSVYVSSLKGLGTMFEPRNAALKRRTTTYRQSSCTGELSPIRLSKLVCFFSIISP
jgi:hypothetical protein